MIKVPVILGLPFFGWEGIALYLMLIFQVLTGSRILKVNFKYHRINGWLILTLAFLHGFLALGLYLGYVEL
ncbi:MAG: hypothetical protein Q8P89_02610 [bacterium]|nr:hypothetical protein [bacterium]